MEFMSNSMKPLAEEMKSFYSFQPDIRDAVQILESLHNTSDSGFRKYIYALHDTGKNGASLDDARRLALAAINSPLIGFDTSLLYSWVSVYRMYGAEAARDAFYNNYPLHCLMMQLAENL